MSLFPDGKNGKVGSVGRSVTIKESPAGNMNDPSGQICLQCGIPSNFCKGHYADKPAQHAEPAPFAPTPFTVGND
jgi:hypothetical protein